MQVRGVSLCLAVLIAKDAEDHDLVLVQLIGDFEVKFDRHDPPERSVGYLHARKRIMGELIDRAINVREMLEVVSGVISS